MGGLEIQSGVRASAASPGPYGYLSLEPIFLPINYKQAQIPESAFLTVIMFVNPLQRGEERRVPLEASRPGGPDVL